MLVIIFAIIAVVCAVKWLCYYVSFAALYMYLLGKEYTPPTEEELKACIREVVRKTLGIKDLDAWK